MATSSKEKLIEIIKNNPTLTAKEIYSLYKNDINNEYQSNIDEKYKVLCNVGQAFHFIDNGYKYYIKINSFDDLGCYIDFVLFDNDKIEMNYDIYHPYNFFCNVDLIKIKSELFFEKWKIFSDFFLKLCDIKNNGTNIDFTEVPNQSTNFFKFIKNNPDILGDKIIELYDQYINNCINKKNEMVLINCIK